MHDRKAILFDEQISSGRVVAIEYFIWPYAANWVVTFKVKLLLVAMQMGSAGEKKDKIKIVINQKKKVADDLFKLISDCWYSLLFP